MSRPILALLTYKGEGGQKTKYSKLPITVIKEKICMFLYELMPVEDAKKLLKSNINLKYKKSFLDGGFLSAVEK